MPARLGRPRAAKECLSCRLAGKRDIFTRDDFKRVAAAVGRWREFAAQAGVLSDQIKKIDNTHRLDLLPEQRALQSTCFRARGQALDARVGQGRYCRPPYGWERQRSEGQETCR